MHIDAAPPSATQRYECSERQLLFESQHPLLQCAGSQGVTPASQPVVKQVRPPVHAAPPLHAQTPPTVQLFATPVQLEQAPPSVPHPPALEPGWQTLLRQHPAGHDFASHMQLELPPSLTQRVPPLHRPEAPQWHAPPLQLSPPSQALHVAPLAPHWLAFTAVTQMPLEQQPLQLAGSHVQLLFAHL